MAAQRILEVTSAWSNPLTDVGGVLRIGSSRVTFDSIVHSYLDGATAEEIAIRFPSLDIRDIYSAILLYLNRREDVNAYLKAREVLRDAQQSGVRTVHRQKEFTDGLRGRKGNPS